MITVLSYSIFSYNRIKGYNITGSISHASTSVKLLNIDGFDY